MRSIFHYSPEIIVDFPSVVGGIILMTDVRNVASDELQAVYQAEQAAVIAHLGERALSDLPALAAWRAAFRKFGVDPTQYRSAPEALLRRLTKKGDIPAINPLVDIGNLVSIRYALPVAVIDQRGITGGITVRYAIGDEPFSDHAGSESAHPNAGEVVFVDEAGRVAARRWCWHQSQESTAGPDTTDLLVTIEAQHGESRETVTRAVADFVELAHRFVGGGAATAILTADAPQWQHN